MAYIHSYDTAQDVSAVESHTGAMPEHATNDLLIWVVSKDINSGGDFSTPAGWTNLLHQTASSLRSAVFYKLAASSSESAPTTTVTAGSGRPFVSHMVCVRDADTTTPIHASASNGYSSSQQFAHETLTTTNNDCLILCFVAIDGAGRTAFSDPGPMFETAIDVNAIAQVFAWTFQETAGTAPQTFNWYLSTQDETNRITIAVNNKSGGNRPSYVTDFAEAGTVVAPLFTNNASFGVTPTGTPSIATIGSKTLTAVNAVATGAGFGTIPQAGALNAQVFESVANVLTGAEACEIGFNTASAQDLSDKFFVCSFATGNINTALIDVATVQQDGAFITFADPSNNYRAYTVFGRDSFPKLDERVTAVIKPTSTSTSYAQSATAPTLTSVDTIQFAVSVKANNLGTLYISDCIKAGTIVMGGGSEGRPLSSERIKEIGSSYRHVIIKSLGSSAYLSYVPLQIGDGSVTTYCDVKNTTIQFPRIADKTFKEINYHADPNDIGISFYGVSGDVIHVVNSTFTSPSPYYWQIHASATSEADWDFHGLNIVGANVTLRDVTTFNGMNFIECGEINATACSLNQCSISGLTGNDDFAVSASTSVSECNFDTTSLSAGSYMCSVANPSIFEDCNFIGSTNTGHAIRITTTGTFGFAGNSFTNYGADTTTSAAIFNDSGGLVTLNISGGGDTPTVRNGASASTVINNAVTITLTGLKTNSEVRVYEDDGGENGDEIDGIENSSNTFSFSADAAQVVNIIINHLNYLPADIWGYTIPAQNATIPISQFVDRQYSNPA